MPNIALFAGGDLSRLPSLTTFDLYVGVDRACLFLLEKGLQLDWAVGDFDSVTDTEFEKIKAAAGKIHQSPAEKDDTDTELALKVIFEEYPESEVTIFGAFGGRIDHFLSNLFLPSEPALAPFMEQIHLVDAQNDISYLPVGQHSLFPKKSYKYISFMLEGHGELEISGAKYELSASNFFPKKIYSSNEFTNNPIEVTVPSGYLVVFYTRDGS